MLDNVVSVEGYKFIPGETAGASAVQFLGGFAGEDGKRWLEDGKAFSRNFSQGKRLHGVDGKSVTVTAQGAGITGHAGLYAVPIKTRDKPSTVGAHPVYEVSGGKITINGKQYPIKLADGFYIIRKLTVTECKRLQTVPEDYIFPVSDTQAYKMLGNGWTVDVIAHILHYAPGITTEPLEVLSMYDGMGCGRLALDKLEANVASYYATKIDKYAIKTTQHNFPDTIQLGDAFQVRDENKATSQQKAIRQFCLDCCGGSSNEVKLCTATKCAIYPFRFWKNPLRAKREMSEEQRAAAAERLKKARERLEFG